MTAHKRKLALNFFEMIVPCPYVPDASLDAVFKIDTPKGQATGFLMEFEINEELRRGLLTCNHVACLDEDGRSITPDMSEISITFNKQTQPISLDWLARNSELPISDQELDFFYVDISPKFQTVLEEKAIQFLKNWQNSPFETFLMAHYGEGCRGISIGKWISNPIESHWLAHVAPTMLGSSGAPLLASDGKNGFVVAMQCSIDSVHNINYAVKISSIIDHITASASILMGSPIDQSAGAAAGMKTRISSN